MRSFSGVSLSLCYDFIILQVDIGVNSFAERDLDLIGLKYFLEKVDKAPVLCYTKTIEKGGTRND